MWLLLIVISELYFAYRFLGLYLSVGFCLIYGLWYFDGKEMTGERRWDAFRRFFLWQKISPVLHVNVQNEGLLRKGKGIRMYALFPGETFASMFWTFGLHGGRIDAQMSELMHYVAPPIMLKIPLLRDVLLWSGAVTYGAGGKRSLESVLINLMNAGRSVAYCPSRFLPPPKGGGNGEVIEARGFPNELLSFLHQKAAELVPVVIMREQKRYYIFRHERIQTFFLKHFDYPFPSFACLRLWGSERPPQLKAIFGSLIECAVEKYAEPQVLHDELANRVGKMRSNVDPTVVLLKNEADV